MKRVHASLSFLAAMTLIGCGDNQSGPQSAQVTTPPDFSGVYRVGGPLLAVGPCDGVINGAWNSGCTNYPYTEEGANKTLPAEQDGGVQCIPDGLTRLNMRTLYSIQFGHEPEAVIITYQFGDVVRTIHLNGDAPPADQPLTRHGYSVGEWRGDMLYIETTHLSESYSQLLGGPAGTEVGAPIGPGTKVVERWWPAPTSGNLLMDMVVEDPQYYERPFMMVRKEWLLTDMTELEPWDCVATEDLFFSDEPDLDAFFGE